MSSEKSLTNLLYALRCWNKTKTRGFRNSVWHHIICSSSCSRPASDSMMYMACQEVNYDPLSLINGRIVSCKLPRAVPSLNATCTVIFIMLLLNLHTLQYSGTDVYIWAKYMEFDNTYMTPTGLLKSSLILQLQCNVSSQFQTIGPLIPCKTK